MGRLAAHARTHRRHEHLGGGQERQVAVELLLDHRRVRAELGEDRQERLHQAVEGEEGVGQCDAPHDRAEHVALVPLRAGELGGHRRIPAQHHLQAVDTLAGTGVHLVRHRGRADLARLEALGDELVPGHQADGVRERRRPGRDLHERGEHVVVQRARIDLTDAGEHVREPEVLGDRRLETRELVGVAAEQVQHVLRGAHGALDAAQRVPGDQLAQPGERDEQLVGGGREPLAEGGGLRGDVVRPARHHQRRVLGGAVGQPRGDRDAVGVHVLEGAQDLQLFDVLGEVAAGHALVHVLVAGEGVELLDAGLHVVAGDALAGRDRLEVDLLEHPLVVGQGLLRDVDPEFRLRPEDRQPQLALEHDLVLRRPQRCQVRAGITGGKNVRDATHRTSVYGAPSRLLFGRRCHPLHDVGQDAPREGPRIGLEIAERAEHGPVDDRDEPPQLRLVHRAPAPLQQVREQLIDLHAQLMLDVAQFGVPGGGDAPFVAGDEALAFDLADPAGADEQVDDQVRGGLGAAVARRDALHPRAHRVELAPPVVLHRARDQVVEGMEVVGGRGERKSGAVRDGAVPDGIDPALEDQVGRRLDERLAAPFALRGGCDRHLCHGASPGGHA
ncbi:hypothetical protein EBESD8_44640 [Rhodococcus aetherivorans]|nr:hypothetical protein EBESD8_44640 [Rhodococcus aetherivorans]